jgi:hypothetical protein
MRRPARERWRRRAFTAPVALVLGATTIVGGALALVRAAPTAALAACTPDGECPAANEDEYSTQVGRTLVVHAPGLLANDAGAASTRVDTLNTDTESWNGAAVDVRADGSFAYRTNPDDPMSGIDYFDYYIEDSQGGWAFNTVAIEVYAIVRNDGYQTRVGTRLSIAAPGVFANDLAFDPTTLTSDGRSDKGGEVTVNEDGSFVYMPPADFDGNDSFTYTVYDSLGDNSFTGTVGIAVGTNRTPGTTAPRNGSEPEANPPNPPGGTADPSESPTSTSPSGSSTTSAAVVPGATSSTTAPKTTSTTSAAGSSGRDGAAGAGTNDDGSGSAALPIGIAVVAVAAAGGGGWYWWRRRSLARASAASPDIAP